MEAAGARCPRGSCCAWSGCPAALQPTSQPCLTRLACRGYWAGPAGRDLRRRQHPRCAVLLASAAAAASARTPSTKTDGGRRYAWTRPSPLADLTHPPPRPTHLQWCRLAASRLATRRPPLPPAARAPLWYRASLQQSPPPLPPRSWLAWWMQRLLPASSSSSMQPWLHGCYGSAAACDDLRWRQAGWHLLRACIETVPALFSYLPHLSCMLAQGRRAP